jgi:hypothetical protein
MDNTRKELVLKVVNPTSNPVNAAIVVSNLPTLARDSRAITLGHPNSSIENTLTEKTLVVPTEMPLTIAGPEFSHAFAPNSLTILRIPAK